MHDLRRQALESGKTVSRKARTRQASAPSSKQNSQLASPVTSRANSRNPSRHGSDDEEYMSDGTQWSTNSIDDLLNGENVDIPTDAWRTELQTRIEQIANLKRSTTEGRADSLSAYAYILMAKYAYEEINDHMGELLPSMLRSIRQETTERETVMALKALAVTAVTLDSDDLYDSVADQLKRTAHGSESTLVKVNALHALGISAFFGGASEEEMADLMTYLLEVVETDGMSIEAHDEGSVVTAALENWGLLATEIDDIEEITETAIEAFVDQLESDDAGVQISAGENIALMYEKSYTPLEDDEEASDVDVDSEDEDSPRSGDKVVKRYTVYRRQDQLLKSLESLANISARGVSKKDRKTLHASFADIKNSVEKPTRGPKYSTAIDQESGRTYGSRMKVRINQNVEVRIDKWWKLQRLNALKRVLQGGFANQYGDNEAVSRCLPFSGWK